MGITTVLQPTHESSGAALNFLLHSPKSNTALQTRVELRPNEMRCRVLHADLGLRYNPDHSLLNEALIHSFIQRRVIRRKASVAREATPSTRTEGHQHRVLETRLLEGATPYPGSRSCRGHRRTEENDWLADTDKESLVIQHRLSWHDSLKSRNTVTFFAHQTTAEPITFDFPFS